MLEPERSQMAILIRRMRVVCWMNKATDIHSKYVMSIGFSMAPMVTRTRIHFAFIRTLPVFLVFTFLILYQEIPLYLLGHIWKRKNK